jgi:hypothetical protein
VEQANNTYFEVDSDTDDDLIVVTVYMYGIASPFNKFSVKFTVIIISSHYPFSFTYVF